MAWRAINSILVLRDQADALAPNRSKASDGTICDTNHPTTSDHCPHSVPGVGSDMVTALDLTHDPAGGFDSFRFAEVLRIHRDVRIKYVISNGRIFSSYSTSSRAAWTWGDYTGDDQHTNHVHISVLDATISDTKTSWNLEGFVMAIDATDVNKIWYTKNLPYTNPDTSPATALLDAYRDGNAVRTTVEAMAKQLALLAQQVSELQTTLNEIQTKLPGSTIPGTTPVAYTFSGTATPKV